ncbi:MAG: MATE family efflux transporter [Myxacorys californica WJT36-NPBG1]|nr:MATE family efflux transporter [Myxacorys californica WJT36-NPBG1]
MKSPSPVPPSSNGFGVNAFFKLAIVNIFSNLMVPLAGWMDIAFLGHLADIRHLAGVSLATVLFSYLYWTFGFLRMGTTGTTAQALGRGNQDDVVLIALRNGAIAIALGLVLVLLQAPLGQIGFSLLSATEEVKRSGQTFYSAMIWGAPATLLNFVLIGWFLGRAQSAKVLLLSVVGNVASVGLDYWFIVRLGWQSAGAGWATALSQYVMLAIALLLFAQAVSWKQVQSLSHQILDPSALKAAFVLNREITIRTFVLISTFAVFTNLSSAFGTEILAVNTLLLQVVTLTAYFVDGFAFATETWAGLFGGRNDVAGLKQLLIVSGVASLSVGLLIAIAFILMPIPLFRLLTNHTNVLAGVTQSVGWLLPILGSGAIAYMLDGYFLGLTAGRILRQSVVGAAIAGFIPLGIIAWYTHNPTLLWMALTLFMVLRAAILVMQVLKSFANA